MTPNVPKDLRLEEVGQLDARSFEMAKAVLDDPIKRSALQTAAEQTQARLLEIAEELQTSAPNLYARVSHSISEALMDLEYVLSPETQMVSLRLNHLVQNSRRVAN